MSKAERYAAHVLKLAGDLGVEVVIRGGGLANRRKKRITIPAIRGQATYMIALHELGHIALSPEPPLRLAQEAAAWRWALDNALDEPSLAAWKSILRALESYRQRQERWASMKGSPEFEDLLVEVRAIVRAG